MILKTETALCQLHIKTQENLPLSIKETCPENWALEVNND